MVPDVLPCVPTHTVQVTSGCMSVCLSVSVCFVSYMFACLFLSLSLDVM